MAKLGYSTLVSGRAHACALFFSILAAGCGGSQKPNPLPPEEPMDQSGSSTSDSTTPTTTAASTDSSSSSADPSAGLTADPSAGAATATPAPTADASDSDPKGKKGKGKGKGKGGKGELSAAECDQIADHELDIVIASAGMDPSMKQMLKQQAATDPNMGGMKNECLKSGTRAQYKCMMAAQTKDDMSKCDNK